MDKIKSFTDLITWQEAHKLVLLIYKVTKTFPRDELFGLTDQVKRAVVSISSNIAEGFSRNSKLEKQQFYSISKGSLTEVENQIIIAKDVGYINQSEFIIINQQIITVGKLIVSLQKYLRNLP